MEHTNQIPSIPFQTRLSLKGLVRYWENLAENGNALERQAASLIANRVAEHPVVLSDNLQETEIRQHLDLLDELFSCIFSKGLNASELKGVVAPFSMDCLYDTPGFHEITSRAKNYFFNCAQCEVESMHREKIRNGYLWILDALYDVPSELSFSMIIPAPDRNNGLPRYYGIEADKQFLEIKAVGEKPDLSAEQIRELMDDPDNLERWMTYLPPENFIFEGFLVLQPIDITETHTLSLIKQDLLQSETLIDEDRFRTLEERMKILLNKPDLRVGFGRYEKNNHIVITFGPHHGQFFFHYDHERNRNNEQLLDELYRMQKPVIYRRIEDAAMPETVKMGLREKGIRSIALVPLVLNGVTEGLLQMGATDSEFNQTNLLRLRNLLPVLAMGVRRSGEDLEHEIQEVIRDQFTALHESVEWKFREVAVNYLEQVKQGGKGEIEPIVFRNVYPFYASCDVRNSSGLRHEAIRNDLLAQLELAADVMQSVIEKHPLPIAERLMSDIRDAAQRMEKEFFTRDETQLYNYLHGELEPFFRHLQETYPDMHAQIERYFDALDPDHQVLYRERKRFEDSIQRLNREMAALIDGEVHRHQESFPFYYELYQTDGAEYNIYMGQSLVPERKFNPVYLKNMRLWQLMMAHKLYEAANNLREKLPMPLETTQLILTQSVPLSIRFRGDENKFDVDGAYNIRYEIVKKRIDKARIKGSKQRLTQPGKLALVYSSNEERDELLHHMDFLKRKGLFIGTVEHLDLEDLPGASGLQALRVQFAKAGEQEAQSDQSASAANNGSGSHLRVTG